MSSKRFSRLVLVLLLVVGGAFAQAQAQSVEDNVNKLLNDLFGGVTGQQDTPRQDRPRQNSADGVRRVPGSRGEMQLSFAPLVKETAPSVVNVYAARVVQQRSSPFEGDPFFNFFFGPDFSGPSRPRTLRRTRPSE